MRNSRDSAAAHTAQDLSSNRVYAHTRPAPSITPHLMPVAALPSAAYAPPHHTPPTPRPVPVHQRKTPAPAQHCTTYTTHIPSTLPSNTLPAPPRAAQRPTHLPRKALAVHVDLEVLWVEVQDGGVARSEQPLVGLGQRVGGGRGQHAHQLVKGLEGLTQVELDVQAGDAVHVCGGQE